MEPGDVEATTTVVPAAPVIDPDEQHNYDSLKKKFWVQVGMTGLVSVFCITMIATHDNQESIYVPILTGLLGYWLPAPDARVKRPMTRTA